MNKIFIDSDVIFDLLLNREPFVNNAKIIFRKIELKEIQGFTSPLVLANLHYILTKLLNKRKSLDLLQRIIQIISITNIDSEIVHLAFNTHNIKDLEDLIQYYSLMNAEIHIIITRNIKDYPRTKEIRILEPGEYINLTLDI